MKLADELKRKLAILATIVGVAPHRGEDQEGFTRITRAAVPMEPHQKSHV